MKKNEIQIGRSYKVKVSGNVAEVRITGENPHGGWDGVNVATNRSVRIKSAQRIRGPVDRPARRTVARTMEEARTTPVAAPAADVGPGAATSAAAESKAKGRPRRPKGEGDAKRPSGLDAAAAVLAEAGTPMNAKGIVDRMLATGLWKTGGKTPASTIYAAMIREIATKGDQARFRKVERGKFTLAK